MDEYLGILCVIEHTDFNQLSVMFCEGGEKKEDDLPRVVGPRVDWFNYDPFALLTIAEAEANRFSARKCASIPEVHPLGFNVDIVPDGWVGIDASNNRDYGDDRVKSNEDICWDKEDVEMEESDRSVYS